MEGVPVDEARHLARVPLFDVDQVAVVLVQSHATFVLPEQVEDEGRRREAEVEGLPVLNDDLR